MDPVDRMLTEASSMRFVLAVLATWRLTHLLASEDGPADLIVRVRARLGTGIAGQLMDCFHCLSLWIAAPAALFVSREPLVWIFCWLAVSGAACLLERLGHQVWIGDAAQIRASYVRRQKTDRRDAAHILRLLMEKRFPRLWVPSAEERDLRQLLIHRHRLVEIRTRIKNGLQHLALNRGMQKQHRLWTLKGMDAFKNLPLKGWSGKRRGDLLRLFRAYAGGPGGFERGHDLRRNGTRNSGDPHTANLALHAWRTPFRSPETQNGVVTTTLPGRIALPSRS